MAPRRTVGLGRSGAVQRVGALAPVGSPVVGPALPPRMVASAFFRGFDLGAREVDLPHPPIAHTHPPDAGFSGLTLRHSATTAAGTGADVPRRRWLTTPLPRHSRGVTDFVLSGRRTLPKDPAAPALLGPRPRTAVRADWSQPRSGGGRIAEALMADPRTHGGHLRGSGSAPRPSPPGPSVHGTCGRLAARAALRRELHLSAPPPLEPGGDDTFPPTARRTV